MKKHKCSNFFYQALVIDEIDRLCSLTLLYAFEYPKQKRKDIIYIRNLLVLWIRDEKRSIDRERYRKLFFTKVAEVLGEDKVEYLIVSNALKLDEGEVNERFD